MKEELLHFIWKYKKLQLEDLVTSKNEPILIEDVGTHNHLAGPDFFNAKVRIDDQLWAGNIEIHIKSSDWFAHNHEQDPNYDNVILHVVWEDDMEVFRSDNSEIPTLELKTFIAPGILKSYQDLFDKKHKSFINCESRIGQIDAFVLENWLERLYFERLERKSVQIETLLKDSKNDWEQVLFSSLLKNFGLKVNGEAFVSLAQAVDYSIVRKLRNGRPLLESLFFGMSHLLESNDVVDEYYLNLQNEFHYLIKKFELNPDRVLKPAFFKLRPHNFPTIRLAQLASLYHSKQNLFAEIVAASILEALYNTLDVSASSYWDTHFNFGKESKKSIKRTTRKFIDLLIVNTILPIKFAYAKHMGKDAGEEIVGIISQISEEHNSIVQKFEQFGLDLKSAKESQSVLQLYNEYCTQNKCLQCAVGNRILKGKD
ncbi:DUF2851 family protein [Maribacter halichondriae]|uniref:DUF2851 family protein n=1 Tax=Maribacter halichondriae TaxID=2980554 RepID=UPI0023586DC9|nr:DUF2851 family protein [Maribacter sp. Hal144]